MFECRLWMYIIPLQLHFQLRKCKIVGRTQIRRVRGIVKSFTQTTHCSHCSTVNACGTNRAHSFHFVNSSDRMWWMVVFGIPLLTAIILQLAQRSFFKTATTWVVFSFVYIIRGLPLRSASSFNSSPAANRLCHQNTIAQNTEASLNPFTNISHIFAAVNLTLQQNFIVARWSKFFSIVIYDTSTSIQYCKTFLYCRILTDWLKTWYVGLECFK